MTTITENHPKWKLYSQLRKCGEITASKDGRHFGLNCGKCRSIYPWIKIKDFLRHLLEEHGGEVFEEFTAGKDDEQEERPTAETTSSVSLEGGEEDQLDGEGELKNEDYYASTTENCSSETTTQNATIHLVLVDGGEGGKLEAEGGLEGENEDCYYSNNDNCSIKDDDGGEIMIKYELEIKEECPPESDNNFIYNSEDDEMELSSNANSEDVLMDRKMNLLSHEHRETLSYIIEVHEQNPILWDKEHAFYPIYAKKVRLYNEIVQGVYDRFKVTLTVKEIRDAFMGLQKLYSKALPNSIEEQKKRTGNTKKSQSVTSRLWCFQQLEFLRDQELAAKTSMVMTDDELLQLADIYQQHYILWDLDCDECHSKVRYMESLHRMLHEANEQMDLNMTLHQLRTCTIRLKRNYRAEKRKRLYCERNGYAFEPTQPELYEKLGFLEYFTGPFCCETCNEEFFQYQIFRKHMAAHDGRQPYTCVICDISFKTYRNMETHVRRHTGEKPYVCSYCDMGFVAVSDLKIHESRHTDVKNFVCKICGAAFRTNRFLSRHKVRCNNPNRQSYPCLECPKKFLNSETLREHMNTHTQVRSSVCPVCGKGFYARKTMRQHMQLHDTVKRYQCEICDQRFAQKAGLSSHKRKHHDIVGGASGSDRLS